MAETRWSRRAQIGQYPNVYVSKFSTGEASISLEELRERFPLWSEDEKLDFVSAYKGKPEITEEDGRILEFLVETGNPTVLETIALSSTRHSNKEFVLSFLMNSLQSLPGYKSNFIIALALLGDSRVIPPLAELFRKLESRVGSATEPDRESLRDLLYCSMALGKLTKDSTYTEKVDCFAHHANPDVRRIVDFIRKRELWTKVAIRS